MAEGDPPVVRTPTRQAAAAIDLRKRYTKEGAKEFIRKSDERKDRARAALDSIKGGVVPPVSPQRAVRSDEFAERSQLLAEAAPLSGEEITASNAQDRSDAFNQIWQSTGTGGLRNPDLRTAADVGVPEKEQIGQSTRAHEYPAAPRAAFNKLDSAIEEHADLLSAESRVRAQNMGVEADYLGEVKNSVTGKIAPYIQEANQILDSAERQMHGIQQMMDDVMANRINPGQFFANIGDAGNFAAAVAVAAGTLASTMGGGPNVALSIIDGAIQRNMRAQQLNQAHDRAMLNTNIQIFDRLRMLGVDRLNMANVYQSMLLAQAEVGLRAVVAQSASAEMRAQSETVLAEFAVKRMEKTIASFGSIRASTQMKIFSQQEKFQGEQQAAMTAFNTKVAELQGSEAWNAPVANEEQQAALMKLRKQMVQEAFIDSGLRYSESLGADIAGSMTTSGLPTTPTELRPPTTADLTFRTPAGELETMRLTSQFDNLETGEIKNKVRKQLTSARKLLEGWRDIANLSSEGTIAGMKGGIDNSLAFSDKKGWIVTSDSLQAVRLANALNNQVIAHMEMTRGDVEALSGQGEWGTHATSAGVPTTKQALAAAVLGDSGLRNFALAGMIKTARDASFLSPFSPDLPDPVAIEKSVREYMELP